mmetsp:Transcript_56046/g.121191  ORF Transcript_56046/g.121191 Transcript_56046/m.121191 type:complete len:465 (+) Transcript_56046:3-1397(+)
MYCCLPQRRNSSQDRYGCVRHLGMTCSERQMQSRAIPPHVCTKRCPEKVHTMLSMLFASQLPGWRRPGKGRPSPPRGPPRGGDATRESKCGARDGRGGASAPRVARESGPGVCPRCSGLRAGNEACCGCRTPSGRPGPAIGGIVRIGRPPLIAGRAGIAALMKCCGRELVKPRLRLRLRPRGGDRCGMALRGRPGDTGRWYWPAWRIITTGLGRIGAKGRPRSRGSRWGTPPAPLPPGRFPSRRIPGRTSTLAPHTSTQWAATAAAACSRSSKWTKPNLRSGVMCTWVTGPKASAKAIATWPLDLTASGSLPIHTERSSRSFQPSLSAPATTEARLGSTGRSTGMSVLRRFRGGGFDERSFSTDSSPAISEETSETRCLPSPWSSVEKFSGKPWNSCNKVMRFGIRFFSSLIVTSWPSSLSMRGPPCSSKAVIAATRTSWIASLASSRSSGVVTNSGRCVSLSA